MTTPLSTSEIKEWWGEKIKQDGWLRINCIEISRVSQRRATETWFFYGYFIVTPIWFHLRKEKP